MVVGHHHAARRDGKAAAVKRLRGIAAEKTLDLHHRRPRAPKSVPRAFGQ